jgi:UDP-GlcNAc:undecaprenyl-phosphate/decaprenyl-phosphate GlcNAc-1-phosphate transferase
LPFLIAAVVACIGTAALIGIAPRLGLVDRPGALKLHVRPTAYAGAAVAIGALCGIAVVYRDGWVGLAVAIVLAGGLWDDLRPVSPWLRLPVQVAAGCFMALGGLTLAPLGSFGPAAVVVATVACCNAVNMVDGQDGLASGLGAIAGLGLAGVAVAVGASSGSGLAVAGAGVGFLVWNRPPARAFLGDGGAYALGVLLVAAAATASVGWPALLGCAVCLGLFVAELVTTVIRRLHAASSAVRGDREHTYDRLAATLRSRPRSTLVAWMAGAALALAAQVVARFQLVAPAAALTVAVGAVLVAGLAAVTRSSNPLREESV